MSHFKASKLTLCAKCLLYIDVCVCVCVCVLNDEALPSLMRKDAEKFYNVDDLGRIYTMSINTRLT